MSSSQCLGILRVGEIEVAVPAHQLQCVVSAAASLSPIADAPAAMAGMAVVHDQPVPVIDLLALINNEPIKQSRKLIAVLADEKRRIGVFVDQVVKLCRPESNALQAVTTTAGDRSALFKQFLTTADRAIGVLSLESLAAIPGIRVAEVHSSEAAHSDDDSALRTIFEIEGKLFSVDAAATLTAMQMPPLAGSGIESPFFRGFADINGHPIAVVDLLRLLGFDSATGSGTYDLLMAVQCDAGSLAFGVGRILGMERQSRRSWQSVETAGLAASEIYEGISLSPQHGPVLGLSVERLLQHPEMRTLVRLDESALTDPTEKASEAAKSYVVYACGAALLATPIEQVEAVVTLPTDLRGVHSGSVVGVMRWLNRAVPVTDLSPAMGYGETARASHARVIITKRGDEYCGFLVSGMHSLQSQVPAALPESSLLKTRANLPPMTHSISFNNAGSRQIATILELGDIKLTSTARHNPPEPVRIAA